ncbi:periplasmic binding protein-like II, partial [Coccomyxa subellipsoidea C-169]
VNLTLVSFAVTRRAYERITQRFAKEYEAATGQPVRFRLSFGGSGTQARAVCDGLPGDIVALALPLDVDKIREAGLINPGWQQRLPNNAIVAESVVAIVTRPGNPKNITGWDDLTRPDVDVITANPKTAGVARWNFFALWGHRLDKGEDAALDYTTKARPRPSAPTNRPSTFLVFERVLVQPRDAREASDVFYKQNTGDVLLNYENEVIFTNLQYGEADAMPYVVPNNNVRVQTPVALVDKNVDRRSTKMRGPTRAAAEAFLEYLFTPEAQAEFVACGFRSIVGRAGRPIDKKLQKKSKLPRVKRAWTVENRLGGWDKSQKQFFGGGGVMDKIQRHVGEVRLRERQEQQ